MLDYPNTTNTIVSPAIFANAALSRKTPSVNRGNVSVSVEASHISLIVYAIPSHRIKTMIPDCLQLEETVINGQSMAWVTVESFLDKSVLGQTAFEQTDYRVQVIRDGQPCRWLLGTSLGSLSAVGVRNLWPMSWHLGAMEFQVSYQTSEGRYNQYNLQTQSQWANSSWLIEDSGMAIEQDQLSESDIPASVFSRHFTDLFSRRDGAIGARRSIHSNFEFTRAELKDARCDLLENLSLLSRQELMKPALVALQHRAARQIFSPTVLNEPQSKVNEPEYSFARLAYAS